MARLHVLAVAHKLPGWAAAARDQYLGRLPRGYEVDLVVLKPSQERRLAEKIPQGARVVALDERGRDYTTREFAALLGEPTVFVIGGADGLDPAIRRRAAALLRLSALTLPHALAQVVLLEQIYRGATLRTGHPYHRD